MNLAACTVLDDDITYPIRGCGAPWRSVLRFRYAWAVDGDGLAPSMSPPCLTTEDQSRGGSNPSLGGGAWGVDIIIRIGILSEKQIVEK